MHAFLAFLNAQPMLTGLVGATLAAGLMFVLRQLPTKAWQGLRDFFSVTLVIEQNEEAFHFVAAWLSRLDSATRARRIMLAEAYDYETRRWAHRITFGRGWHLIRYAGAWLLLNREVKDSGEIAQLVGAGRNQRLWLMCLGRSQAPLRALIAEAKADYFGGGLINVHFFHEGSWLCGDRRRPRPLDTVFMPPAQKTSLLADVRDFLASRDRYEAQGVPWRRGYLLEGQPGTGKTTLIFAIASALGMKLYALNLNNIRSDNELFSALHQVETDAIVVIEDIDTTPITNERGGEPAQPAVADAGVALATALKGQAPTQRLTLSGLLNAIDGLASREGRLLFITSNHAEKLDSALLRPGRIDRREVIAPLGLAEATAMIEAFGADDSVLAGETLPIPAAVLQGKLLAYKPPAVRLAVDNPAPPPPSPHGFLKKSL